MRLQQIGRKVLPKLIRQTSLNNFAESLPDLPKSNALAHIAPKFTKTHIPAYSYEIVAENILEIKETHCLNCGQRLVRNGFNERHCVLDAGEGEFLFRIHRKRCKCCGEIRPDFSALVSCHGRYHENYIRRSRQHYMEGLMPSQIQRVFSIDFNVWISRSSLVRWINKAAPALRRLMVETPVPSSGYWGYDEIFLRVAKTKKYSLHLLDLHTNFWVHTAISDTLERGVGRKFLQGAKRGRALKMNGLVKDGGMVFGNIFQKTGYKHVKVALCHVHLKWNLNRFIKQAAGLPKETKKPLPAEFSPIQAQFYAVIDSRTEGQAYILLEGTRAMAIRKESKHLKKAVEALEASLPKILTAQADPWLAITNNQLEGYHHKIEYYPAFKRKMKRPWGCERVLDYRTFGHNFRQFLPFRLGLTRKFREHYGIGTPTSQSREVRGQGPYFKKEYEHLNDQFGKYSRFYEEYLKILNR